MPQFALVPLQEALSNTTPPSERTAIIQEYVEYINQLRAGRAGRIQPSEGETTGSVRRRLGEAAKLSGKELVIKRVGDEIYFWTKTQGRRRGRPRRS